MGHWESSPKREIHRLTGLYQKKKKTRKSSNKNLTLHLKELEKEQQTKPKMSRRKEIIKIRSEINEIESKKLIQKVNESKSWFFEKINKTDKPLTKLIKKKRERTQINTIRNERGEITSNTTEIQMIIRNYNEEVYARKFANLGEMDKFLEKYNHPKLNKEAESMNRAVTTDKIEALIKKLPTQNALDRMVP